MSRVLTYEPSIKCCFDYRICDPPSNKIESKSGCERLFDSTRATKQLGIALPRSILAHRISVSFGPDSTPCRIRIPDIGISNFLNTHLPRRLERNSTLTCGGGGGTQILGRNNLEDSM
jgi:hypothetical protein